MIARKLLYYLRSLATLSRALDQPWSLVSALLDRPTRLVFRTGLEMEVGGRLDLLLVEEVMLSDAYGLSALEEPAFILDVGAGIGELTVAAGLRFPGVRVIAIEPHPGQFRRLRANVEFNGLTNVDLHQVAAGLRTSYGLAPGRHAAESRVVAPGAAGSGQLVEGRSLSELMASGANLLKIDCEGAELEILRSLEDDDFSRLDRIVVEYHRRYLPAADRVIGDFLEARGFAVEILPDRYDARTGLVVARNRR